VAAYWDASAVVPLCCAQSATKQGRRLLRELGRMVVWWGTPVETRSALARLVDEERLDPTEAKQAVKLLSQLRAAWNEILPTEQVRRLAETLPDTYTARAADAFQLAASLVWCGERPRRRSFVCFDDRLARAAEAAGFTVYRS
jgi:predicted nucleic acid-binding protein